TIYSTLAAGAERLVARQLLNREAARLIAILPLPQNDYLNEFAPSDDYRLNGQGAELRKELKYWLSHKAIEIIEMSPSSTRNSAYLKAGYYIAEHSDVLIAIWDGNEQEDSSITVQIVDKAEKLNKPVCHIWADNFELDPMNTKIRGKCGQIRYKNFDGHEEGKWK
ncbi:MAG: hypothetical protein PHR04_05945, partial [Syntrophomonadaceae bacterium]|nr:hypothetical protein [Syntrophomonadaceae bacterium]